MITTKIARFAIIAVGSLLICAPLSRAADAEKPKQDAPPPTAGAQRRGMDPQAQLDRMAKQLNLTAEQKAKLKPILEKQFKEMQALRENTALSQEDRRTKYRELRDKFAPQIKAVLTADQAAKWEKMQQDMRTRRPQQPQ